MGGNKFGFVFKPKASGGVNCLGAEGNRCKHILSNSTVHLTLGSLKFVESLAGGLKPNPLGTAKTLLHIMHTASPIWLFAATINSQTAFFYSQWLIWLPCGEPL